MADAFAVWPPATGLAEISTGPEQFAGRTVHVWGRIARRHRLSTITFVGLRSDGVTLQVGLGQDHAGSVRLGELWWFSGLVRKSRTGTTTLFADEAVRLAPGPGPERALLDCDQASDNLLRSAMLQSRAIESLQGRGYVHVPTPIVVSDWDGGRSRPSTVQLGRRRLGTIRSNHEAPLQALLGSGLPRVCVVGNVMRNGREYSLLEAHAAFVSFEEGLNEAIEVLAELCASPTTSHRDQLVGVAECKWERVDAIARVASLTGRPEGDVDGDARSVAAAIATAIGVDPSGHPEATFRRFLQAEADRAGRPLIFQRTPVWSSPLYKPAQSHRPGGLLRAVGVVPTLGVLFDAGEQQNDADEMEEAIRNQRALSLAPDEHANGEISSPLVRVLRRGVPPSFGFGSAIERLLG